jgi:hypothetical protein
MAYVTRHLGPCRWPGTPRPRSGPKPPAGTGDRLRSAAACYRQLPHWKRSHDEAVAVGVEAAGKATGRRPGPVRVRARSVRIPPGYNAIGGARKRRISGRPRKAWHSLCLRSRAPCLEALHGPR